jgi:tetratricopeptide (TPR) repeat protein
MTCQRRFRVAPHIGCGLLLLLVVPGRAGARQSKEPPLPPGFDQPMKLYERGLGALTRKITTTSGEAQAYFDQGLQFLYSFTPRDAARSFREAWKRDPQCAMCYFGEAWAFGPYLNGDMAATDAPLAFRAIQQAKHLSAAHATAVERAMIEAMAARYTEKHDAAVRERLDTAYSKAMAGVWAQYPQDLDVGTLYAESLMLIEPRRGTWDVSRPEVQRIHSVLENLLGRDINHPGACHLYVHATESTVRPEKAEACADRLGLSIPGASHINHMPSHTYNRVGRWGDAVRANIQAWHSDLAAEVGEGFAIYPSHNLHMLLFSASYDGQGAIAIQAGKDYAKISPGGVFYHVLTLFRFGRFDELLQLQVPALSQRVYSGFVDFGRGYAHLRLGHADSARSYLEWLEEDRQAGGDSVNFRGHTARQLLGIVSGILRGELERAAGRSDEAVRTLEQAVALEDSLRYDEPEPLNFAARHWLGAALLEAKRPADAERVYRAELERHPRNGWSLYGLEQALRAQNRAADAAQVHAQFEQAWARSDTWLRASRF